MSVFSFNGFLTEEGASLQDTVYPWPDGQNLRVPGHRLAISPGFLLDWPARTALGSVGARGMLVPHLTQLQGEVCSGQWAPEAIEGTHQVPGVESTRCYPYSCSCRTQLSATGKAHRGARETIRECTALPGSLKTHRGVLSSRNSKTQHPETNPRHK